MITNYFNYELRFKNVISRKNLPRIKDGAYMINLNDNYNKRTHWVLLFSNKNTVVYFDFSRIEYISQEVLNKIKDKLITHNVFIIQDNKSIMRRFYWIAFIEYMTFRKNFIRLY